MSETTKNDLVRPRISVLYVTDHDSYLTPFRGENVLRTFTEFYRNTAQVAFCTATPNIIAEMGASDLRHYNVIWFDNTTNIVASQKMYAIHDVMMQELEPNWRETLKTKNDADPKEAYEWLKALNTRRANEKLRIVYQLDEFIWEGVVGRMRDIQTAQSVESMMNIADTVIVPTPEMRETIEHYKLVNDENKDIQIILTGVGIEFCPILRATKTSGAKVSQLADKPKLLIKGISIPKNVDTFVIENYKKMDITLCSIGEISPHLAGLMKEGKVKHIYHWANPSVNRTNIYATWAMERDAGFDFVILTKPDDLSGRIYELTTGDEDVLFAAACGSVPIVGFDDLEYEETTYHLSKACPSFGSKSTPRNIRELIEAYSVWTRFAEAQGKIRIKVENRLTASPGIMSQYFNALIGPQKSEARQKLIAEQAAELDAEQKATLGIESTENIIEGNFGAKE